MKQYFRILTYAKPYLGLVGINVLFSIVSIIFGIFSLALLKPFLDLLFEQQELVTSAPEFGFNKDAIIGNFNLFISNIIREEGKSQALVTVSVIIVISFFLKNITLYLSKFFLAPVRFGVIHDIRNKLYSKVLRLPVSYFSEKRKGDVISRMTTDVVEMEWTLMGSIEMLLRDPVSIIAFMIVLFSMSAKLTLFAIVLFPLSGALIGFLGKSLKRTSSKGQTKLGEILSTVEETLGGLRVIKAFNAEQTADKRFQQQNRSLWKTLVRLLRKRDLASPLSEFLGVTVMAFVMWYGGSMVLSGEDGLDAATFITFILLLSQLLAPIKSLSNGYSQIQKGAASAERILEIIDAEESIKDKVDAKPLNEFKTAIELKDVSFAYEDKKVLKHINLSIPKGKTIALVGQSGSGKSTLADLVARFYDIEEGVIALDGISIKDYKLHDYRKHMGIVSQQSILFNDTILNNIALGVENPNKEAIIEAAKIANAHDFILETENGYETNIGDGGGKLSGGQRQRISIARAIFKNPPILILDEATSALDTESEKLVQDALYKLMENRTTLVIAHRLSTIQHADEIIVMHEGEIVERGTHTKLVAKKGTYNKLYELQAFD